MSNVIKLSVNGVAKLSEAIAKITAMFREHKFLVISIRPGKDRTLDQNGLWFAMYKRIAEMTEIGDEEDARKYCKLHMGVPVMRRACDDFRRAYDASFLMLPYETKLDLMGSCALFGPDGFPVTRLFDRAQGIAYTDKIAQEFGAKGVVFDDLLSGEAE